MTPPPPPASIAKRLVTRGRRDAARRRQRQRDGAAYEQLIKRIVNYVWRTDERGVVIEVTSGEGLDALGVPPEKLLGKTLEELGPPEDRARLTSIHLDRIEAKSDFSSVEVELTNEAGAGIWFELSGVPEFDQDGRFLGYWGVARDVNARKRAEEALIYRDKVLNAVTQAALELVGATAIDAAIPRALELIGLALDVDRVVVLETDRSSSNPDTLQVLHTWQSPRALAKFDVRTLRVRREAFAATPWSGALAKGALVSASADSAAAEEATALDQLGAQSVLIVPIRALGQWWGAMAVDDCVRTRNWTEAEINALSAFAEMVGASILRREHQLGQRRAELELQRRVRRDHLTGLANRLSFTDILERALARAGRHRRHFAVHYLDLDHFKDVNDTLGHPVGDELLKQVAFRLRNEIRHDDVLARFGGDEFAVLQMDAETDVQAGALAQKLVDAVNRPFQIGGRDIQVGASVGVVVHRAPDETAETLLSHVELALYRAKAAGRHTYRHYDDTMDAETRSRVRLDDQLRKAIEAGQFFMVYQPQVDIETGRIVGVEALIRWRHPQRGVIMPNEFIPAAERSGTITSIGGWVLQEVARQARKWLDQDIAPPVIGVNVSPVQFRQPDALERELLAVLQAARLPRGLIQLELTETTLMEASTMQSDVLARLHDDGVKISLDDFGMGYSSLDYLRRYPVDQIKIAGVFVAGITHNAGDGAIVRAAIGLARELGVKVLAEGAERPEQARLLKQWGCPELQGWYFAKALTADAIEPLLRLGRIEPDLSRSLEPDFSEGATTVPPQ